MEIAAHREKIERLTELMARLDPVEDFEIWMWASMNAATNALNAVLHRLGLTQPGSRYPHQIPGLYVDPEPIGEWRWRKVFAAPGDVIHIGLPPLATAIPDRVLEAAAALREIEDMREDYVRGTQPIVPQLAERCAAAYHACMAILDELVAGLPGEAA
jgi:hypothetical protein